MRLFLLSLGFGLAGCLIPAAQADEAGAASKEVDWDHQSYQVAVRQYDPPIKIDSGKFLNRERAEELKWYKPYMAMAELQRYSYDDYKKWLSPEYMARIKLTPALFASIVAGIKQADAAGQKRPELKETAFFEVTITSQGTSVCLVGNYIGQLVERIPENLSSTNEANGAVLIDSYVRQGGEWLNQVPETPAWIKLFPVTYLEDMKAICRASRWRLNGVKQLEPVSIAEIDNK